MKKNIVILGGGFGGISAALSLLKKFKNKEYRNFNIVLVDKNSYHLFTPLLYEVATASRKVLNASDDLLPIVALSFNKIFGKYIEKNKIKIVNNEVEDLDVKNKKIIFKDRSYVFYDYLVLSLGMKTNFFGIKNSSSYPLFSLKTLDDALKIREKLLELESQKNAKIVIGGGGATGLELASEIKNQFKNFEVTVVDAASRILNNFDYEVSKKTEERLLSIGVNIVSNEIISEVKDNYIILKSGKIIKCDFFICALGIKPTEVINKLPFLKDKNGRIKVNEFLKADSIFAIGDIASLNDETPPLAHFAITEGKRAAENIIREIRKKELKKYKSQNYPYIIPLGGKYAISKLGPFVIKGKLTWIFKGLVELNYFLMILPFFEAFKIWFKGLILFIKHKDLG